MSCLVMADKLRVGKCLDYCSLNSVFSNYSRNNLIPAIRFGYSSASAGSLVRVVNVLAGRLPLRFLYHISPFLWLIYFSQSSSASLAEDLPKFWSAFVTFFMYIVNYISNVSLFLWSRSDYRGSTQKSVSIRHIQLKFNKIEPDQEKTANFYNKKKLFLICY